MKMDGLNGFCAWCTRENRRSITLFPLFGKRVFWPVCGPCRRDIHASGRSVVTLGQERFRRYVANEPAFHHEAPETKTQEARPC
jgi:hypothetical protein